MDQSFDSVPADLRLIEAIAKHCEPSLGNCARTLEEIESPIVHVDLMQFELGPEDPAHVFVTCGMSSKPMNVPGNVPNPDPYRYAELVLCLPGDWPMDFDTLTREENWWPLHALRSLARLPHERETWLWGGHTVSNDPPEEPYAANTKFCGAIVCPNAMFDDSFEVLSHNGRDIVFLQIAFLYREELEFAKANYSDALMKRVIESGVSPFDFFVLNSNRPNVVTGT